MKLENINFKFESELPSLEDMESTFNDDCFTMAFTYNGLNIEAIVDIYAQFVSKTFAGTFYSPSEKFITVTDCSVEIREMYDKDGEEIILTAKEVKEINEILTKEIEF